MHGVQQKEYKGRRQTYLETSHEALSNTWSSRSLGNDKLAISENIQLFV